VTEIKSKEEWGEKEINGMDLGISMLKFGIYNFMKKQLKLLNNPEVIRWCYEASRMFLYKILRAQRT
jgi:hypothetical protein